MYVGDLNGLNNIRVAYSTDGGMRFHFERGDILRDAVLGDGSKSFVDHKLIQLPEGRYRMYVCATVPAFSSFCEVIASATTR